jgi:hypothetical protein
VTDAAGAIYVIGGYCYKTGTLYHDVWASTDGGARPAYIRGGTTGGYYGATIGVLHRYYRVLGGTMGYHGVPWGTKWWSRITTAVKKWYSRVLKGYSRGTHGVLRGY